MLDLTDPPSPTAEKTGILTAWRMARSRFPSQKNGVIYKRSVWMNSLTMFAIQWTISSATMASLTLLMLQHTQKRLQWCAQQQTWMQKWYDVEFSDEFQFCLLHHDAHIPVWQHCGDCMLPACLQHHSDSSSGGMIWDAIGCMSLSLLVCIDST